MVCFGMVYGMGMLPGEIGDDKWCMEEETKDIIEDGDV
jgi:hypothetical protein